MTHAVMRDDGRVLAGNVERADSVWQRFMGLMGRTELADGSGLWLQPCSSIHMFFMRMPIDAVFVDGDGRVLKIHHGIRPWRMTWPVLRAKACLELPAGWCMAHGLHVGERITLRTAAETVAAAS